jgi:hypothetical protein
MEADAYISRICRTNRRLVALLEVATPPGAPLTTYIVAEFKEAFSLFDKGMYSDFAVLLEVQCCLQMEMEQSRQR